MPQRVPVQLIAQFGDNEPQPEQATIVLRFADRWPNVPVHVQERPGLTRYICHPTAAQAPIIRVWIDGFLSATTPLSTIRRKQRPQR